MQKRISDIKSQNEGECLLLDWLGNFDNVGALLEKVATSEAGYRLPAAGLRAVPILT